MSMHFLGTYNISVCVLLSYIKFKGPVGVCECVWRRTVYGKDAYLLSFWTPEFRTEFWWNLCENPLQKYGHVRNFGYVHAQENMIEHLHLPVTFIIRPMHSIL